MHPVVKVDRFVFLKLFQKIKDVLIWLEKEVSVEINLFLIPIAELMQTAIYLNSVSSNSHQNA